MEIEVKGKKVVITFDLDEAEGRSMSGKSIIVASTHGNTPIPGTDVVLGLNAYRPVRAAGGRREA